MFGKALVVFAGFVAGRTYNGHDKTVDGGITNLTRSSCDHVDLQTLGAVQNS